jgi:hypothetical protein
MARSIQQQGLPRQSDQLHEQCDLDLLRRQEFAGREVEGHGAGHRTFVMAGGTRRPAYRAAPDHAGHGLQVHEISEGSQGVSALHDRTRAIRTLAERVPGLCDAAACGLREESHLDRRAQGQSVPARHGQHAHHGYAGKLGCASAGAIADFIIVDMVAEAASGDKTLKQAAERAALRAQRYYKV